MNIPDTPDTYPEASTLPVVVSVKLAMSKLPVTAVTVTHSIVVPVIKAPETLDVNVPLAPK